MQAVCQTYYKSGHGTMKHRTRRLISCLLQLLYSFTRQQGYVPTDQLIDSSLSKTKLETIRPQGNEVFIICQNNYVDFMCTLHYSSSFCVHFFRLFFTVIFFHHGLLFLLFSQPLPVVTDILDALSIIVIFKLAVR